MIIGGSLEEEDNGNNTVVRENVSQQDVKNPLLAAGHITKNPRLFNPVAGTIDPRVLEYQPYSTTADGAPLPNRSAELPSRFPMMQASPLADDSPRPPYRPNLKTCTEQLGRQREQSEIRIEDGSKCTAWPSSPSFQGNPLRLGGCSVPAAMHTMATSMSPTELQRSNSGAMSTAIPKASHTVITRSDQYLIKAVRHIDDVAKWPAVAEAYRSYTGQCIDPMYCHKRANELSAILRERRHRQQPLSADVGLEPPQGHINDATRDEPSFVSDYHHSRS